MYCQVYDTCRSNMKVKVAQSGLTLYDPMDFYSPWNSPGQNTGVGSLSRLQGIFPTKGSNPGLPLCRWIIYQLSHKECPRILEWVAYPVDLPNPGIFLTWESNQDILHCRHILYQLSSQGSPYRIDIVHITKQRHYFANKVPSSQSYGFSSSHIWM